LEERRASGFVGKNGYRRIMGGSTPHSVLRKRKEWVSLQGCGSGRQAAAHLSSIPVLRQLLTLLLSPSDVQKRQPAEV